MRARGLLTKGKNGTNDCFVTIAMDKEKYQTSIKEKAETNVQWEEACELKIPDQGNRAELILTCLHRNNFGLDEFLGQVTLPLNTMDVYDRPRPRWYKLESKPGKEKKNKDRGELEVRIGFIVKSGSLSDLSKKEKHKSSIGQLASSVGGSLLSIGTIEKRKGIKKFAKSLGSKMHLHSKKKNKENDDGSFNGSLASIGTPNSSIGSSRHHGQHAGDADPGVISEDEDEFVFDNLSHKSSASSLSTRQLPVNLQPQPKKGGKQQQQQQELEDFVVDAELEQMENDFSVRAKTLPPPSKPPRTPNQTTTIEKNLDEWETKLYGKHLDVGSIDSLKRRSWEQTRVPLPTATEEADKTTNEQHITTSESEEETPQPQSQSKPIVEQKVLPVEEKLVPLVQPRVSPQKIENVDKIEKIEKIKSVPTIQSEKIEVKPQALPRVAKSNVELIQMEREIQREQAALDEQEKREEKRREEDQRLLNFAKRSISGESDGGNTNSTPEQSPKERVQEKRDKRLSKFKYFSQKRGNNNK